MESKKRAERRRACDLRKKAAAAEEERVRAAEQLLELQTLAKTTVLQEQQAQGLTQAAAAQARARRVSKRTANYTEKEDKVLVDGWLTIGQDALTGAEQKGTAFWRRIYEYFHEHRKYGQEPFESDRSEISLQKRWGAIQTECNKFQAAYDHAKRVPVSGMGMKDLVWRALEFYKVNNGEKTFAFPHCWKELHDTPKFQEGYEGYMATLTGNNPAKDATVIDLDGGQPCGSSASRASRPRGHKSTKADMKRDASSMLLYGTLKEMHADREVSTDKRDERRCWEKEEDRKKFFDVQQKKLEIEEVKAKTKAKELELKERELEYKAANYQSKSMNIRNYSLKELLVEGGPNAASSVPTERRHAYTKPQHSAGQTPWRLR
nr:glutathione S-transferase T3-like [Lolium perenne]